jgi:3-phenylpropionate/trans-cinnamate dioxygenase ferredoxin component
MGETYVRACALTDVPEEGALGVEIDGTKVAIVRSQGEVHAIHDSCTHAEVPLSEGEVYNGIVECWLHGSCFDLKSGDVSRLPATVPVPVYRAKVEGDDILVSLG